MLRSSSVALWVALATTLRAAPGGAIINQVDGTIVPDSPRLQQCLDKSAVASAANPAPGEGAGIVDAVRQAAIAPQTFLPAPRVGDGRRVVTFTDIGEGAGYENRFGWYNVGDSPFTPSARQEIFDCRATPSCDCPCSRGPRSVMRPDAACVHWLNANIVELDFDCLRAAGRWRGGPIAFYIMTPEFLAGGSGSNCPATTSTTNRVYSTDNTINDDGDYVHFLIYTSRTFPNAYYFGWEDLFRGGDNDFEDMLTRAIGLVPTCNPVPEVCDGRDNNCNGMVDEGLGTTTCGVGACRRTVDNCTGGRLQTCTPGAGSAELCDGVDNNCNGAVDEGVSRACSTSCGAGIQYCTAGAFGDCVAPAPAAELCDGRDNDCNGMIDDGLTRPCRTGCGMGLETCRLGAWVGCTAPTPMTETCNGLDDNCNGLIDDGVAPRPCRSACGPGTESCIGGAFVCNAPQPRPEVCDGMDNDCNGAVDDGVPPGGSCGAATATCRAGTFVCRGGRYVCEGASMGAPETCNGLDDNCNGVVDEGDPGGGASCNTGADGARLCAPGTLRCRDGMLRCVGGTPGRPEQCNCRDDDCNGTIDDPGPGRTLCPGQGRCIACDCRTPCRISEFMPCSEGLVCNAENFCVPPFCGDARTICPPDEVCRDGRCVDPCVGTRCPAGQACQQGRCVEDNCYGRGCPGTQLCLEARCVNNPCLSQRCAAGQFCRALGEGRASCVPSCGAVRCAAGQSCVDGQCRRDPCASTRCLTGQLCEVVGGFPRCVVDPCLNVGCGPGRVCARGRCVDDPCAHVTCPGAPDVLCRAGQCLDPSALPLPPPDRVIGAGGGGCATAPRGGGRAGLALAALWVGFVLARRRRGRAPRGSR